MAAFATTIARRASNDGRRFRCVILTLALTMILTCPALPQPIPFFYRTDYSVNYAQLGEQGSVIIADLNNDDKLDFAIGGGFGIAVALGNGDGTFQPIVNTVPTGGGVNGAWTLAAAAADFDGDGNIDLVLESGAGIIILPGKGDGTFGPGRLITSQGFLSTTPSVQLLEAADLNHDGRPDLVFLTQINQAPLTASAIVLLNNGDGTFTSHTAFNLPSGEDAVGVAIADLNRDGTPDLAVVGRVQGGFGPPPSVPGHIYVGLGKGDGSFAAPVAAASLNQTAASVAAADFNHDGAPDLAVGSGPTLIFLNNGDGSFRAGPSINLCCSNPGSIAVGDWTGSGNPGLGIFSAATPNGIGVMVGNGNGTFYSGGTAALDIYAGNVYSFSSADLNGDGLPDLVVPSAGSTVSVFLNAGVSPPLSFVPESAATDIASIAPASIATIYGQFPISDAQSSGAPPTPTQLAGVTVNIRDSAGVTRPAPLFYVSPTQINLEVPAGTAPGVAAVTVESSGPPLVGSALVRNVVPSIFTEQDITFQGGHYPAAYAITYSPDGQPQPPVLVATCQNTPPAGCSPVPIPRPAGSRVFLELFATGIRNHVSPVIVSLTATGVSQNVMPAYAGPQGQFDGLDQVNLEITNLPPLPPVPLAPPGMGYYMVLNVDGFVSNAVQFVVQ